MSVIFKQQNHIYESLDPGDGITWTSVTRFLEHFKEPFDAVAISQKCSKNPKSKWYGIDPQVIQGIWKGEGTRGASTGDIYHGQRESDISELSTIDRCGVSIPIIRPIFDNGIKHAPDQRLTEGIYPEHFVYLKSAGICGQSDRVEIVKDTVDIVDYKTNKKIDKTSFKNWEGISKKMLGPVSHLDDCNFNHYSLQLSLYLYIILKHNPRYKPGKLVLQHVVFEKSGEDKYGYPILKKDPQGDFIVQTVIPYECPYLKDEVRNMINWYLEIKNK